jgi:hypothetical protein
MEITIQSNPTPTINIVIKDQDKAGNPTEKTWKVCLDYPALAKIQDTIGIDIKNFEPWKTMPSTAIPKIVWCGINRYNPDVTLEEVLTTLNPQAHRLLSDAIFELTFPGVVEAYEKTKAEKAE